MAPTATAPPPPIEVDIGKKNGDYIPTTTTDHDNYNHNDDPDDPDNIIPPLRSALTSESTPLSQRFRALFSLKHHASLHPPSAQTLPAITAIASAFTSPSALLKHELAYCLGQTGHAAAAVPHLQRVVRDRGEDAMCRHEAAEALGALEDEGSLELLRERWGDEGEEVVVRETCEIAIARIEWACDVLPEERVDNGGEGKEKGKKGKSGEVVKRSDFASVDPAPPVAEVGGEKKLSVQELQDRLMDRRLGLFERYRAMFALRDLASPPDLPTAVPAVLALAEGFADTSALFRHEIAFVFGQLSHPASIPALKAAMADTSEASMVRHEAAEALGSLGEEDGVEDFLRLYLHDEERVVRDSVVVALDMAEYERGGEVEYAVLSEQGADGLSGLVRPKE